MSDVFTRSKDTALLHVKEWLPDGHEEGGQWVAINPMRNDRHAGSFKINLFSGAWNDYADETGDAVGHDAISLYAYLNGMSNFEAAKEILLKYDADYFPEPGALKKSDTWFQLVRGHKSPPELPLQRNEIMRWQLESKFGQSWRIVMMITRAKNGDAKQDYPHTLWSDSKNVEWRMKALHGCKYPLYGLRALTERPNAPVVLYEGQKVPSILQPILGDEWVCVGWYGGSINATLTDFSPLLGREVFFCFDGDSAGRKAIKIILDELHVKANLVYPPSNVPKGWDHADAVEDGWKKDDIIKAIRGVPVTIAAPIVYPTLGLSPENRPSRLDIPVTDDFREYITNSVFFRDGEGDWHTMENWQLWIVKQDNILRSSMKFDYTTGVTETAYDNMDIFEARMEQRLADMGINLSLQTSKNKSHIKGSIIIQNQMFNRVTDYMDMLSAQYPNESESILDDFMKVFIFDTDKIHGEDSEDYVRRCDKTDALYRELLNIFLIRMHGRIHGTRKLEDESYKGLIENDIVPILEGPQNIGKTTLCQWLACEPELYVDLGSGMKQGFGSAETVKKVRGRLIAEIGEMGSVKKADVETVKSFISMKATPIDIKFVEKQKDIPMTASFMGTDNNPQYLMDDTGNRRFWPVKLKNIDKSYMNDHRDIPYRLHSYYSRLTRNLDKADIFKLCKPSEDLEALMDDMREKAMITYSDYEVCLKIIQEWKSQNMMGGALDQSDIEKSAMEAKYPMRISQRSFKRAMKDCGFMFMPRFDNNIGKARMSWVWEPKSMGEDAPF